MLIAAGGAFGYAAVVASDDTILPNVYVMDQNLGGMTKEQATQALQTAVSETYGTLPLTVQLPDRTLEFDPAQVQATIDVPAAVEKPGNMVTPAMCFPVPVCASMHRRVSTISMSPTP